MIDYQPLIEALNKTPLRRWATQLPEQIAAGLSPKRHGQLPRWYESLNKLPVVSPSSFTLDEEVRIGAASDISEQQRGQLYEALKELIPWRKGPFTLFDIEIDTEWRSDWKWQRLLPHIAPLKNRLVLDVGCGNGYHCWRMLGEGARRVIGIDPSPRFVLQFYAIKHFLSAMPADVLPLGIQDLPENLQAFDSVFSMGVLYHRRSPMDHLLQLRDALKPGGEVILETLIIEGKEGEVLVPPDRYGKMNNVWFIPSAATLKAWMLKCGFENVRCVDRNQTSVGEQRKTEWITSQSLEDFLDPNDPQRTIEGHPAPLRGLFLANRKNT